MSLADATLPALPRQLRRRAQLVDVTAERLPDAPELAVERAITSPAPLPTPHAFDGLDVEGMWRQLGADPDTDPEVRELVARNIAPLVGGSPVGASGLGFQHNLPEPGTFVENSDLFFRSTERNDIPAQGVPYPGLGGGGVDVRIPQVGVLASIRIIAKLTLVVSGAGTITSTYQWPWNALKRVALNVNGQTGIIGAQGLDIRARRQRVYRNPREEVTSIASNAGIDSATGNPAPGVIANGTYAVNLVYDIPITHDDYNLVGALYAQSDSNAFFWRFEAASLAELFTAAGGSTATLTGTLYWTYTVYDIPAADSSDGRKILLPNMSWLHGFLGYDQPYANTGEVQVALIRTAGQLLATYLYMDNGGAAQHDPLAMTEIRQQYGGNRRSRVFNPPDQLIEKNVHDYNGRIKPGYVVLDNEVDNPVRDLIYPKGVTELAIVVTIPAGTTINANARAHAVEETMFPGR